MTEAITHEAQEATQDRAAVFLMGNLIEAAKKHFTGLTQPWHKLTEAEQTKVLQRLADDCRLAARDAVTAIASHQRLTFRAEVASVNFKGASDVIAQLKMIASNEAHSLADAAGGFVTVVIEDTAKLLDVPDEAIAGEPDQPALA